MIERRKSKPKSKTKTALPVPTDAFAAPTTVKFLTKKEVLQLVGVSYSTLWSWIRDNQFPPARELNPGGVGHAKIMWIESEVLHWMATRPQRLPKGAAA